MHARLIFPGLPAVLLLCAFALPARADSVQLKSGGIFHGTVIAESETSITIRTSLGEMKFAKRDVAAVRRDEATKAPTAPRPEVPEPARTPSTEPAPARDDSAPRPAASPRDGIEDAPAEPEDEPTWQLLGRAVTISDAAKNKAVDFMSMPDWGLLVHGPGGLDCVVDLEEDGSGVLPFALGARLSATLVDIDVSSHDLLTEAVSFELREGERGLTFADGSRVNTEIRRFDPEAKSGADRTPEGAGDLPLGTLVRDSVGYRSQDRTDHRRLRLDRGTRVEGILVATSGVPEVAWGRRDRMDGSTWGPYSLFQGRLEAGIHWLRLRARREDGGGGYQLLFTAVSETQAERELLVKGLLDLASRGPMVPVVRGEEPGEDPALSVLVALDCAPVRDAIVRGLDHDAPSARALAASAAGRMQIREAASRLDDLARGDRSERVRRAAAEALRRVR